MNRFLLSLSLIFGCAATIAVGAATGAPRARTLDLRGTMTSLRLAVDEKPQGPSAGDLGYVSGKLLRNAKQVGRYSGVCAQLGGGTQQCTFVLGLPEGQIVLVAGYGPAMNVGAIAHEAVVGGTGAYEGARGQGDDRELGDSKLAFHLHLLS